ncbi:MAG: M20/M25/M40 family metallo-hydrolase [Actinomycetota bacterium]|nr:M20/M25/M40 family metallo-hydrolase [Actinomycetota bacterium]
MPDAGELEQRTTQLLQRLIQFDTVNPPGAEEKCQHYLRQLLERAGFSVELLAAAPGRPNLVARLAAPSGADGPTLCLLGHVDTVLANPADWEVSPWSGDLREDGCVWGRGALDMKSQVAAEVAAACMLAEAGWRPEAGELKLVLTADEETGASYGAQWLCSEHPEKVRADLIVNEGAGASFEYPPADGPRDSRPDSGRKSRGDDGVPTRIYPVCVAEKGVFRFTLTAHGRAGHASLPRIGENALTKLAPLLSALGDARLVAEHSPEPDAFLTALGIPLDDLDAALARVEATDPRIAVMLEPLLGITFAPTMATASEKINVIPSEACARVDCRVPPGLGEDHVRRRIHDALGWEPPASSDAPTGARPAAGVPNGFSLEFDETVVGNRSPIDTPLMETIRSFVSREDPGAAITATALAGFSDSHWFRAAFPDCLAYGFFPQRRMDLFEAMPLVHGANERIPVEDLGLAARFFAELVETTLR